jgi:E1-E2 ATPase/Heavy metal associated domain 2
MVQANQLSVDLESGKATLRTPALGHSKPWGVVRELVGRLLAAECVETVLLDRRNQTATIHFKRDETSSKLIDGAAAEPDKLLHDRCLKSIANRLRDSTSAISTISDEYAAIDRLQLQKTESGMTAGMIVHSVPGRVRVRHPLVRGDSDLSLRIKNSLAKINGVQLVSVSTTTGSVLVTFDKSSTNAARLVLELEDVLTSKPHEISLLSGPPTGRWVASGTCLSLAVASEFFVPGLTPVTATALVGFNLSTMGRGIVELCTLKWRVASLYTVIMGTTLISGQFLAAALMHASITCWHGWSSHRLRKIADRLKSESELPIVICRSHQNLLMNGERFPECLIGTIVTVEPQMTVPYDGIVVDGEGLLDERCVRGSEGISRRSTGDTVYAGSFLTQGQLRVRVTAVDKQTRVVKVRETLLASIAGLPGEGGPTERGHDSASSFVPYTFATGTAALMVGDLTTLAAVLRPDFATGPSMSERFGTLSSVGHLWNRGWLVKKSETLHELAKTETVVVVHGNDNRDEYEDESRDSRPGTELQLDANRIGRRTVNFENRSLDIHDIEGTEAECVSYIRELRSVNCRLAVVANGKLLNRLADFDLIRISLTPENSFGNQSADLVALHSEPHRVEELWRVLQESRRPNQQGWAAVMACNMLAVSGAFLIGLTSLHVVVLTNLGALAAGALYSRHVKRSSEMLLPSYQADSSKLRADAHEETIANQETFEKTIIDSDVVRSELTSSI